LSRGAPPAPATKTVRAAVRKAAKLSRSVVARTRLSVSDPPVVYWWRRRRNFGDWLNPLLVRALSGRSPVHSQDLGGGYSGPVYSVVGSVLQHVHAPNLIVWGSGFISADSSFRTAPAVVHAVRGPLTRARILSLGLSCPAMYGDPALLYPRLFPGRLVPKYDLGIIPHYADRGSDVIPHLAGEGGLLIDVEDEPHTVVSHIRSCRAVASSSLHGIIIALSLGIPAVWVEFSRNVKGDGFKFRDFYASIGAPEPQPLQVSTRMSLAELADRAVTTPVELDVDGLLAVCPFRVRG
jgi:pyruvyltransferase